MKRSTGLILTLMVIVLLPSSSDAKDVVIDATHYTESNDVGSIPVGVAPMGHLQGLDMPGEWTKYTFSTTELGAYGTSLLIRGTLGVEFHLQLVIEPVGVVEIQKFDFFFTGLGFG
ncbi:MAG: hypothetical protein KOO63_11700 [Bacteroidales bacterium]|nr:hypothetical protein [Candidatus Latescibacterota bacterium]